MKKLENGTTVKILSGAGLVSEMFIGKIGTIIGKCGVFPGAVVVRVDGFSVSYYLTEIEIILSGQAK